ncbi:uncharacterized protein TNCV_1227901 [Trichonephila clavipes]|nr:uncharacterized protein TNCV_1227901 [Trichonephila clavipes]
MVRKDRCVLVLIHCAFTMMNELRECQENIPRPQIAPASRLGPFRQWLQGACIQRFPAVYAIGKYYLSSLSGRPVAVLACEFQVSLSMNSRQHRCLNQASVSESQTQQCLGNTVGGPLVYLGGQLLNGSTPICSIASPQPSFTSVICDPWCTTFATSLIFDSPSLLCTVHFYHSGTGTDHKLRRFGNASTLGQKANDHAVLDVRSIDLFLHYGNDCNLFQALAHPFYTLNCTELPPAFCDWLFNVEVENTW